MDVEQIRALFPITRQYNFLNHAAVAPISKPAADAMIGFAREVSEAAYLRGTFYRAAEHVRGDAAKLINADPSEVTFVKNTSEGVNYVARGIQWISGDNVVSTTMEFPANVYPWMSLESRGVTLRRVADDNGRIPFDRLVQQIDKRTRVVAISAVQWSNGLRMDLTRLGELCKNKGVLLFVDAIQALGVHPIDVQAMNIDFLSAGGHKWLTSPEGTGIFYCKRELIGHIKPSEIGYMGVKRSLSEPVTGLSESDLYDDARRFDSGVYNLAGLCALGASIGLLLDVGINQVQVRVKQLTDILVEGLKSKGWKVYSPRTATEWSGIVSFGSDKHDIDALRKHLRNEFRIIVANRLGRLRASPHFYNTPKEMQDLIDALPGH